MVFPTPIKNGSLFAEPLGLSRFDGLPGKTRTYDLMVRSHALYPAGLRADRLFMLPQVIDAIPLGRFRRFHSLIGALSPKKPTELGLSPITLQALDAKRQH